METITHSRNDQDISHFLKQHWYCVSEHRMSDNGRSERAFWAEREIDSDQLAIHSTCKEELSSMKFIKWHIEIYALLDGLVSFLFTLV